MERNSKKYFEWKSRVNVRDNFICQECGKEGSEAHHIQSWKEYPDKRFEVSNGITLCLDCHKKQRSSGRPKTKYGKNKTYYLSIETIEKLIVDSRLKNSSMSQYIEDLINGMTNEEKT